jgi:hypothetical protein
MIFIRFSMLYIGITSASSAAILPPRQTGCQARALLEIWAQSINIAASQNSCQNINEINHRGFIGEY